MEPVSRLMLFRGFYSDGVRKVLFRSGTCYQAAERLYSVLVGSRKGFYGVSCAALGLRDFGFNCWEALGLTW